jgi:cobalt/nickel transport system permease protein
LKEIRTTLEPRRMPLLGLAAAFVFAAQMLNFPVAGGTSGHLIGGVLTAVLLGPSAAVLVLTCVLLVQCLLFADGGLLALGANVFNMAIVSVCGGTLVFRGLKQLLRMEETRATVFAASFAAWFATVLASLSCAGELAFSGTVPWSLAFPAMTNVHLLIGIGEGAATGLVVLAVLRTRPDLVQSAGARVPAARLSLVAYSLLVAVGMAVFVAPFACSWPDGLESVARTLGFENHATASPLAAPMASYQLPFIGSATTATALAGLIGTLCAFIAAYALARMLVPALSSRKKDAASGD